MKIPGACICNLDSNFFARAGHFEVCFTICRLVGKILLHMRQGALISQSFLFMLIPFVTRDKYISFHAELG